ncbi:PhzF family phenazine biosynthesis protein [Spirosoma sp. BT702]|uniref:PhzF family phenazine biosynthesis protein n=1 Tax=Spirosoma profusum TaxID=2771354 RepID=A0A927AUP9_9BACT|nr:PhzF family phenazine biosynthesis protein [Spirosoma profusum]MBD2704756.1 PhzF family phenazine biosynthesis protein [Spirosoma profusum]
MNTITYYIVDVFANARYEGNQLAVFLDLDNQLADEHMQRIAREINFAETTFIKENKNNQRFVVRIFTPEHEVPFAGHPSLGTSYVIAKFLTPKAPENLTLELIYSDIEISIREPQNLNNSLFYMRQTQPEFRETFDASDVAKGLEINVDDIDPRLPIQEISTGLPYIIIPLKNLVAMENLELTYQSFKNFLLSKKKYRTNSSTGHSTSLFFFTKETYGNQNNYNARMLLIENNKVSEDSATGSANGCLLAYLLTYEQRSIKAVVEQGFQINRNSYIYLDGELNNGHYVLNIGGRSRLIAKGIWYV